MLIYPNLKGISLVETSGSLNQLGHYEKLFNLWWSNHVHCYLFSVIRAFYEFNKG